LKLSGKFSKGDLVSVTGGSGWRNLSGRCGIILSRTSMNTINLKATFYEILINEKTIIVLENWLEKHG
jgi:hypothetical protein